MKTIAALGVFWLLLITAATAQPHQLGPWRVKYKPGEVEEYHVNNRDGGSTLMRRTATELVKAAWDVPPDSIRLFLNCNNPLLAPPTRASIRFTATGATLRLDKQHQLLWIFPTAPTVTLTAHQGKAQLFTHGFQAVAPPPPEIRAYITGLMPISVKGPARRQYGPSS